MVIDSQRDLFHIPRTLCYLNAAYMTPFTRRQKQIGVAAIDQSEAPWSVTPDDFFETTDDIRRLSAQILNAHEDDMAIIPSASYGLATASRNLDFRPGDYILVLEDQFPSNVYEWRTLATGKGGHIHTVATPGDDDWTRAVLEAIDMLGDRLAIVALANVHWASGSLIDLEQIAQRLKGHRSALVLDMTQSLGAMPFNVQKVDPDFLVAASYKWLLGPYSLGVMYVAKRHQHGRPLEQNWIVRQDSANFAELVHYKDDYQTGARRFDVGERSNFILAPVLREGLRQILEWGVEDIAATLKAINIQLADICSRVGFKPIDLALCGPHMISVKVGHRGPELLAAMRAANVHASLRGQTLRLAPHLYVDDEDISMFESVMARL